MRRAMAMQNGGKLRGGWEDSYIVKTGEQLVATSFFAFQPTLILHDRIKKSPFSSLVAAAEAKSA